jgi:hypothetical protein
VLAVAQSLKSPEVRTMQRRRPTTRKPYCRPANEGEGQRVEDYMRLLRIGWKRKGSEESDGNIRLSHCVPRLSCERLGWSGPCWCYVLLACLMRAELHTLMRSPCEVDRGACECWSTILELELAVASCRKSYGWRPSSRLSLTVTTDKQWGRAFWLAPSKGSPTSG